MLKSITSSVALCAAALFSGQASAYTLLGQTPDASVIVSAGGYDWVWASPCAPGGCSNIVLHDGYTYATAAQWNASFSSIADLAAAFTNADGSNKCASTYFDVNYDHCDMVNVYDGHIWQSPLASSPDAASASWAETFLIRANAVPEPANIALMMAGIAALGVTARRRKG